MKSEPRQLYSENIVSDKKESRRSQRENIVFSVSAQKCKRNLLIKFTGEASTWYLWTGEDEKRRTGIVSIWRIDGFPLDSLFSNKRDEWNEKNVIAIVYIP